MEILGPLSQLDMQEFDWEEKLTPLVQHDHQIKNILLEKGIYSDGYHPDLEKIQLRNAQKIAEFIKKYGFPVLSNAGENGVRLSWLIIHHAISWPDFMRDSLVQMRMAAAQNDYPLELLAYTEDLVAYLEGRPQLYGTHSDWIDGELKTTPVEDPKGLEYRRKSMGLNPIGQMSPQGPHDKPPQNPLEKHKQFNQWLVRIGWRNG